MPPTLYEIRDGLRELALQVEDLRRVERGSTADVLERFALDLGHHYEAIRAEIAALERWGGVA